MSKVLLLSGAVLVVAVVMGCQAPMNPCEVAVADSALAIDESVRAVGLDRPSLLHMRDTFPSTYYSPYR